MLSPGPGILNYFPRKKAFFSPGREFYSRGSPGGPRARLFFHQKAPGGPFKRTPGVPPTSKTVWGGSKRSPLAENRILRLRGGRSRGRSRSRSRFRGSKSKAEVEFDPGLARSTLEFDPLEAEDSALRAKFDPKIDFDPQNSISTLPKSTSTPFKGPRGSF